MDRHKRFPDGFLWGASTSAHQVEGENQNSWSKWEEENAERLAQEAHGKWATWQKEQFPEMFLRENYISGRAADHYHRYEKDFDIAQALGHNAHRFSIEWSRIEPREGFFDTAQIDHYRSVVAALRRRGIEPFVTLWHWTNPLWIEERGGWEHPQTLIHFVRYVETIAKSFGPDEIKFWMPLNEPGTYIGMGYVQGSSPPNVRNLFRANRAFKHLMEAYRLAYRVIHHHHPAAHVGMSHYASYVLPYKNKWINRLITPLIDYVRNWRFLDSIADTNDFIGIQYYHIDCIDITWNWSGKWGLIDAKNPHDWVNDLNWSMHPEGIYPLIIRSAKYGKPIYITESGLADKADSHRVQFIKETLLHVHRAIQEGAPVKGYLYWSLLDNFEWDKGYWPRFGLVEINYKTLTRTIRKSALYYRDVCQSNMIK